MVELLNRGGVVIESLESRTFLSASPASHLRPAATPRVKLTIPNILGNTYQGTLSTTKGATFDTVFTISRETKGGAFHATFTVTNSSGYGNYAEVGTINLKKKITMHGKSGKVSLSATATLSADLTTVTGRFISTALHQSARGPFSLTLVTAVGQ